MKLICKDTNKGSITFITKGKYAFRGVNRNYGWRFSMAPEASVLRSIRSSDIDTRSYKPYKLIVFDDGCTFVGNGDVLAHDTDKVLSFGDQPEGEYLCDSMGLDRNVIVEYFNKIGNG